MLADDRFKFNNTIPLLNQSDPNLIGNDESGGRPLSPSLGR